MALVALFRVVELLVQAASPFLIKCADVKLLQDPADASSIAQSGICLAADLDPLCFMPHHCPCPCRMAASPCIFSLTFICTSKNLETHRSKHTDSPLLRSPSRYSGGMHFLTQDWFSLFAERETEKGQRMCVEIERRQWDGMYTWSSFHQSSPPLSRQRRSSPLMRVAGGRREGRTLS